MRLNMKLKYVLLLLLLFACVESSFSHTRPVKGTWVNLFWQDERNNYMNPRYMDITDPLLWKTKIEELHDMGMEYVVIMAVANEERACYPSGFMEPAYPEDRQSPVEAIMEAADECGMSVFMSCGWAKNQLDNLKDPDVKETQLRIMEETARLFSGHKSFYGWYLPVEDSFEPVLSDHAVQAVNALAARARELTPGKMVMISPYGLCNADYASPKFAEQIRRLKVDIIAYQDEVGCVREPMPMRRMKEHFKILGDIHEETGIRFWANVESFTWDRETNSWYSSLVPAAFGRYLSQLVSVSQAGVDNVLSFSIYGIYDRPGSPFPLGQPVWSNVAYNDYMDWLSGKGRWPLLEATFYDSVANGAQGKTVSASGASCPSLLTDGDFGYEDCGASQWCRFDGGKMEAVIDLENIAEICSLAVRFLNYAHAAVSIPRIVDFYVSDTGECFEKVSTVVMDNTPNVLHDCWIDLASTGPVSARGRYVKVVAECEDGDICCDEIFINPVF